MEHAVASYQELSFSNFGSADQSNAPGGTINNSSGPGNHFTGSIINGNVYLGPEGRLPRQLNPPVNNEGEAFVNDELLESIKTQACVKFINDVQIEQPGRWSRLLWLKAESPRALFRSLQAMHENFEMRRRQGMDSLDMGQKAEITAADVSNWLSGQEQPWLMILDHLSFHNAVEAGDGLGPESMKMMLRHLFKATNGRIIISSRHSLNQCLSSQEEPSSVRHMNQETAFQLVKAYFPKKSLGPKAIFSRAWQGSLDEDKFTRNTQDFNSSWTSGWLEFLKHPFKGSPSQSEVLETHQIGLKFLARRPGEAQWQGSVTQRSPSIMASGGMAPDKVHDFPALALQMWEAYTSLVKPTRHSVDELIQYLVHAETLEQCGKHQQSLEVRESCRENVQKLQIQDPATGGIIAQDSTRLRVLRLMVQRDIADSHWKLGSKGKSSHLLKAVLCELEQVQIPAEERGNNYLRTLMIETQLARVRCLVRHEHDHEEASTLIMRVLVYTRQCVEEMPRTQRLHLQALSLEAEIKSARGQRLETMIAMMAYANSLSRLGRHEESLQLRKKIEQQLCRDDCTVPQSDDFFVDSRQNLAKCYMASAEMLYDRERRKYEPKGLMRTALAIKTIQHVLEVRQANKKWGHIHTDTLATLALLIKYERKAKSLGSDCGIERWTADTALDASRILFEDAGHVTDAWLMVLIEDCLVDDPEKRLARLEMLRKARPEIERPEHRKVEVLIRREIATAHMKVLHQYKSREKKTEENRSTLQDCGEGLGDCLERAHRASGPRERRYFDLIEMCD
ncbi:hypothetical protein FDENT_13434 [Fusarium denticulatum]|uniref:NACHT-NTPase sigma domain-containing protein n=1 Tax=Fusarium denticulatum TaxID=48507 RepID=A0A8H5T2Y9_9HYPO|nr:hypothetical protein FDENT_13434 [Fusarium denticulatum]